MDTRHPRIISASRRTDLPAFHTAWFIESLRQGRCQVPDPFNPARQRIISLLPQDVDGIVFWTRNAAPLAPWLHEVDARQIPYYFLWTITGYPRALEARTPDMQQAVDSFRSLAVRLGPARMIWRYDPVIITDITPAQWHEENFARLCAALKGCTQRCITSFVEPYVKTRRALAALARSGVHTHLPGEHAKAAMAAALHSIAANHNITLQTCCTPVTGIHSSLPLAAPCVDAALLQRIGGNATGASATDKNQREHCLCAPSTDIGRYGTCRFGCVYCYARR